jgi:site-specific recombinase XerD
MLNDKNKLEILFWLKKQKTLKNGLIPIYCRITINKKRCNNGFSTGLKVFEKDFNKNTGRVLDTDQCADAHNDVLAHIENEVRNLRMLFEKANILANKKTFFEAYKKGFEQAINQKPQEFLISELFEKNLLFQKSKNESNLVSYNTIQRYNTLKKHFYNFLKTENLSENEPIKKLNRGIFESFKIYLFSKNFKNNYISRTLSNFVGVFAWGSDNGFFEKNIFEGLSLRKVKEKKIFLTKAELQIIENKTFEIERLEKIKNLFLLSCYTGLAFADLQKFTKDNVKIVNGVEIIEINRQKSKVICYAPMFEKTKIILEKYDYNLKVPTNQKYNAYLKEIQVICNIDKKLCTHTGRKTFINLMLNVYNVPSESVMQMVGHTNLKTTYQYYADISAEKVVNDIKNINI